MPSTSSSGPTILQRDLSVAVGESGPLCLVVWRGQVTKESFALQRTGLAYVVSRHPAGAGLVCVVEPSARSPDPELRRASAEMVSAHGSRLRCIACVVEGEGFKAAINRGALAAMTMLLPKKVTDISVFSRAADATSWVANHVQNARADSLVADVEAVRNSFRGAEPHRARIFI